MSPAFENVPYFKASSGLFLCFCEYDRFNCIFYLVGSSLSPGKKSFCEKVFSRFFSILTWIIIIAKCFLWIMGNNP